MPANLPAAPAPVPAEAVAPSASDWWRPGARARVPAPAAWSPTAECPVCAEPPSKTPPRPAAVTLAARDAKVKPRPRRATTQLMSQASASPASNPDFQAATGQIRVEALRQRTHPLALRKRTEVEKSAKLEVKVQEDQSAKDRNAIKMGEVGAEQLGASRNFSAAGFKADLKKRVESKPPKSEEDAKKLAKSDAVQHFEQDFSKGLATEQGKVTGPLNQQASGDPKKAGFEAGVQAVPIPKPVYPPPPGPVDPSLVVPKPKPDPEVSLQQESDRLSGAMQHNRLSDDQLEQSREPSFLKTLKAKQDAQQKIGEARIEYRRQEAATLQGATAQANQSLSTSLTGMSRTHTRAGGRVAGGQKDTESKTQKRQREIKQTIDEIYERTAGCVKCTLETLTKKVTGDFTRSLKNETDTFNSRVRDRLDSYYSTGKKVKHFLLGEPKVVVEKTDGSVRVRDLRRDDWDMSSFPPRIKTPWINPQVYKIFLEEKDLFIAKMDVQLDAIAKDVQTGLTTANNQIQAGKDAVTSFIGTLGDDELRFAKELEQDVLMKFENLESTIDDAREDLLATLADQYRESVNQLETTFNEINDELKKTWLDRAVEFIETVGKTIFQLAELLFSILVRLKDLVWDIISHPIRFFETLVAGLKQGISDFIGDIGTHLKEAFWTWLTDATPGKTIRLSLGSGVAGLFDLVVQVLNLGPADLRAIVDRVLGPEFMQMVDKVEAFADKAFEPVMILLKRGPVALWDYIKEQLEEIIQSSFDRIKESVFLAFVKKGILWIAGFFVPGGGFVKIVKAIVRAFQFVAENLERIRRFFDAVFDSMEAATQGNPAGVASKIVTGLKMGIALALGFLARQLGLNAIIDGVHRILHSLRRPIVSAIEWVLRKVKPFVLRLIEKGKELWAKGKQKVKEAAGAVTGRGVAPSAAAAGDDRVTQQFTMNGVGHMLDAVAREGRLRLFMASRREFLDEKLDREASKWSASPNPEVAENGRRLAARLTTVKQREQALSASYLAAADRTQRHALAVAGVNEIAQTLVSLAAEFGITVDEDEIPKAGECRTAGLDLGRATRAYADPLTIESLRDRGPNPPFAPGGTLRFPGRQTYAAGHLVADTFGGTVELGNLALVSRLTNGRFSSLEANVRKALRPRRALQEPATVLRYVVQCEFPANGPTTLEEWMRTRYAARLPGANFSGIGDVIFGMMARKEWNSDVIAARLGVPRLDYIDFNDDIMAKAALLYLPIRFRPEVTVRAGAGVSIQTAPIQNHIGNSGFPG